MHRNCSLPSNCWWTRIRLPGSVWLTGSQSFPLMKGVSESLAGRVAILNLLGFSARESDQRPAVVPPFVPGGDAVASRGASAAETGLASVYTRIWRGSFPALVTGQVSDRDLFYRSYVQTYLQRDVRDLLKVGDLDVFMRFLKAAAARTGQLLNYTDLARDCAVSVNTARGWMAVLQASHQVFPPARLAHESLEAALHHAQAAFSGYGIVCLSDGVVVSRNALGGRHVRGDPGILRCCRDTEVLVASR